MSSSSLADLDARARALDPPVFLFETSVPPQIRSSGQSSLHIVDDVARTGAHSLRWDYRPRGFLEIDAPLGYRPDNQATLAFWMYQFNPSAGRLRLEFGRGSGTDAWCEVHLDFTGWRTAWIRYQDLSGSPHRGMNRLRFIAPEGDGTLYLDQLIVNKPLRTDWPAPDRQVPFVGDVATGDNQHWLDLLYFSQLDARPPRHATPSSAQLSDLDTVKQAYQDTVSHKVSATASELAAEVDALGVPPTDSRGRGRAIVHHQDEIYPEAIADDIKRLSLSAPLRDYCQQMHRIAAAYDTSPQPELADLYVRMLQHLWDQGWDAGSVQGTIHHLGYGTRKLYTSFWLMREPLQQRGLLEHARATLAWMVGRGRTRQDTDDVKRFYNGIFDIFNTTLMGLVGSALLEERPEAQATQLVLLKQWLDRAIRPTPGIECGFKSDLATFHHVGHYPDYARDGFKGGSPVLAILSGTAFMISHDAHALWNHSLLRMRFYANKSDWPLSLANRHPTGQTGLSITPYADMTRAGSPDGRQELDPAMGAAFLRLLPGKPNSAQQKLASRLAEVGVTAEESPNGCHVMNHAAAVYHRRLDWLVAVRGHNRYLWNTEIYPGSNVYGRYVTYGQIQIMNGGDPINNRDSGYIQPSWDWNRWPGTTTVHLPFDQLHVDFDGGNQEELLTDKRLGGGGTIDQRDGAFMIDLHENAKYDGSFHARKSVFLFDNRVIALGTNIRNADGVHNTETTLFQRHLDDRNTAQQDSALGTLDAIPYESSRDLSSAVWLLDPQQVGYYVPGGQRLTLSRSQQTAPDQAGSKQATAPYATAFIDHGTAPQAGSYQYAMVIDTDANAMSRFTENMNSRRRAPYIVLQQDDIAHVVHDRETRTTGYAIFEPADRLNRGLIRAVDTPAIVLARTHHGRLVLSVTDPDLRFYDGKDTDKYDVSPFDVAWRDSPSQPSRITLHIAGRWAGYSRAARVRPSWKTSTVVIDCCNGLPTEVSLHRI